jgi:hypothetical protein
MPPPPTNAPHVPWIGLSWAMDGSDADITVDRDLKRILPPKPKKDD